MSRELPAIRSQMALLWVGILMSIGGLSTLLAGISAGLADPEVQPYTPRIPHSTGTVPASKTQQPATVTGQVHPLPPESPSDATVHEPSPASIGKPEPVPQAAEDASGTVRDSPQQPLEKPAIDPALQGAEGGSVKPPSEPVLVKPKGP